jgi:hypothetical protein
LNILHNHASEENCAIQLHIESLRKQLSLKNVTNITEGIKILHLFFEFGFKLNPDLDFSHDYIVSPF